MEDIIIRFGGVGLAAVSFVAATVFPLSSEAALFAAIRLGLPRGEALVYASVGNCLGVLLNYALGFWGSQTILARTMQSRSGQKALEWSNRYGRWSLLLSWLPIVGDPLTIVAGALRVDFLFFFFVAAGTRVLRYGALVAFV